MSNTGWAAVIIVLVIILGGWWWYSQQQAAPAPTPTTTTTTTTTTTPGTGTGTSVNVTTGTPVPAAPMAAKVHFTSTGFSPATVTIAKGGTVTFVDDTSAPMWVASDEHPTHTEYDNTSRTTHCAAGYTGAKPFDQCKSGSSYSFMFGKAGSFNFHNHSAAQYTGRVVVQ